MQNPDSGDMQIYNEMAAARLAAAKFTPPAAVFSIGEELDIKGGRFKIVAIGKRYMRLESLPRKKQP